MTSVIIPNSVTTIKSRAFRGNLLTSIIIPENVTSIKGSVFQNNALKSVTFPEKLKTIGDYAFFDNLLTSIIIPKNVTSIGYKTFNNNSLTSIISKNNTPPAIKTTSFGLRYGIELTIPEKHVDDYIKSSWTDFLSVNEEIQHVYFTIDSISYMGRF